MTTFIAFTLYPLPFTRDSGIYPKLLGSTHAPFGHTRKLHKQF
ncbi:MAG: hypothetical protein ACJ04O_09880 [Cellvibrionales bacterium]